ncbi:hypothetical protein AB4114_25945 [Paenibacillus sp. 2RAB27]|uniref:hypothetical protein n=1 Tax=Paenibacillus sp. 2RAB27 TaxID=3232991 RepID=UPI003F9B3890
MDNRQILSALSYFSVFFAPFLLPIVIYFVVSDREVKHHAKWAFLSHCLPVAGFILTWILGLNSIVNGGHMSQFVIPLILTGLAYLVVFIWNIVMGIKVLAR